MRVARVVSVFVAWIDGGAPKGDIADMPKMPALADGWTIGKPDAVYSMTEDYKSPPSGTIDYLYLRIPVNLPEDRWYTAVEIKPSARAHVHNIIAYTEPSSDKPTRPGNTFGPTNITGVSPDKPGLVFDPGASTDSCARHRPVPDAASLDTRGCNRLPTRRRVSRRTPA